MKIAMGEFNAKLGEGWHDLIVGPHGLGFTTRNERGDALIEWCVEKELIVTITWFKQHMKGIPKVLTYSAVDEWYSMISHWIKVYYINRDYAECHSK